MATNKYQPWWRPISSIDLRGKSILFSFKMGIAESYSYSLYRQHYSTNGKMLEWCADRDYELAVAAIESGARMEVEFVVFTTLSAEQKTEFELYWQGIAG